MTALRALVNVILVFTVARLVRAQHGEPINFASAAIKSDVARHGEKAAAPAAAYRKIYRRSAAWEKLLRRRIEQA